MVRTTYPRKSNKGFGSKSFVDFQVHHETLEEGRKTHRLNRYEYNNEDENNSPNDLNDKKYVIF